MRLSSYFFLSLLLLAFSIPANSQDIVPQKFKVIGLPQNAGYDINVLNKELKNVTVKPEVIKILKSHSQLFSVPIVIRIVKSNTEMSWWRINPGTPEKEGDFAILQSKANESNKFYSTNEVKKYFHDTIACFDTLRLGMYIQNENFRIENYFVKIISNDLSENISIPFDKNNNLLITSSIFHGSTSTSGMLYNKDNEQEPITHCNFLFLDNNTKICLINIAKDLQSEIPGTSAKDLANYLSTYIQANYGKASFSDITRFLTNNMQ